KRKEIQKLKREFSNAIAFNPTNKDELNEDYIREVLSRNYSFFGEEKMEQIRNSFVIVVGVGGVGSHAAHMLMRSGVGKLRIIDFDEVSITSLNRHAVATKADVNKPKVIAMQEHFKEIYPFAKVEAIVDLFNIDKADSLLDGKPDYVLDCIDNIQTKLDLIEYCVKHNIKIISSTGAGAKCDPSRIQIADISDTKEDPLARATRRELRKRGIESGVPVVYSTEKPGSVKLLPLPDELYGKQIEGNPPNFRARVLPVFGTIPAMFGNAIATYVLTQLADWPIKPLAIKNRDATYTRLHKDYAGREQHVFNNNDPLKFTTNDIGYIFEEIWSGRSALSGNLNKLTLTRWDRSQPPSLQNIICLTKAEAEKH
ncbi:hypothetical protein BCR36DRAFT_270291, partial [Piromyces finnis]